MKFKKITKFFRPAPTKDKPSDDDSYVANRKRTFYVETQPHWLLDSPAFKSSFNSILIGTSLVILVACATWIYEKHINTMPTRAVVQIQIKALTTSGEISTNAKVYVNGSYAGTTDSQGEWRRYYRTSLGNSFNIEVIKNNKNIQTVGSKLLVIPLANSNLDVISFSEKINLSKSRRAKSF